MGNRNPSPVRGHVGGGEERDVARIVRICRDPDGAVEGGSCEGTYRVCKKHPVIVGVAAVVAYGEAINKPDEEIAPMHLGEAVHDVAVRVRLIVRG